MTIARPAAPAGTRRVDRLDDRHLPAFRALVDADPIANAVVASRLGAFDTLDPARFGGVTLGTWRAGELSAAAFHGGNLLPVGGSPDDWAALAGDLGRRPRLCASIVGRAEVVSAMWSQLRPAWGAARAVRPEQPLLLVSAAEVADVPGDPRLRLLQPADLAAYLPAAIAMFTEELGVSPTRGGADGAYRRRVESLLATGRAFGIVADGHVTFKADIGALTPQTCQLQGVWVRPDLRGRGVGTAAMAAVVRAALRLAPTVSLYVNDFNVAARRLYARIGMHQIGTLSTVLF